MKPEPKATAATGLATRAVHAGSAPATSGAPVVTPVVQSATFYSDADNTGEVRYTRYGTNPNHLVVADKLAALEGAEAAIVLASGMAATSLALLSFVGAGDHILAARALYGGTARLLQHDFPRLGIETTFVAENTRWAHELRPETRLILVEAPSNPTLRLAELPALGNLASARGIPLIVDATFATPYTMRPLEHGADVVIHSATKYLGGHADITAGVVAGSMAVVQEVREKLKSFGPVLDPHACWLLERGLKTLPLRVERQCATALALASWLESHPAVKAVYYPGLPSHPDYALAKRLMGAFGGMLSFVAHGGDEAALRVLSRLRIMSAAPSLGGVETLVSMPRFTSHARMSADDRHAAGIDDGFIRVSVGIEDFDDLRDDVAQALEPELR